DPRSSDRPVFRETRRCEDAARGGAGDQRSVRHRRGPLPAGRPRLCRARGLRRCGGAAGGQPRGQGPARVGQAGGADERRRHIEPAHRGRRHQPAADVSRGIQVMATATRARKPTAIKELHDVGQSLWLDNIRRQLISSGELARLRDEGLTGVTSNPTIFEKAVSGSTDYDEAMVQLVREKKKPADMLWELMVEDVQAAADVFRPVHDKTKGKDGFVS